jgi:hypothetical protein
MMHVVPQFVRFLRLEIADGGEKTGKSSLGTLPRVLIRILSLIPGNGLEPLTCGL